MEQFLHIGIIDLEWKVSNLLQQTDLCLSPAAFLYLRKESSFV